MTTTEAPTTTATARVSTLRPAHPRDALVVGGVGFLVAVAFSWIPSVWYDEAATVTGARRSLADLAVMLESVDVVHALYYVLMHGWFAVVGYTPFTLRLPSAIAAGVAVALTMLLVQRIGSRRLAVISGLVLMVLPRFTWAGIEGRSFALGTAATVGLTLLLVVALDAQLSAHRDRRRTLILWAAYAAVAALSTVLFLYLAFVIAAHAVAVLAVAGRRVGRVVLPFGLAAAVAVAAALPAVSAAYDQSGQVGWIPPISDETWYSVFTTQFFPFAPLVAHLAWPLAAGGVILLAVRMWRQRRGRRLLVLCVTLLVVPVVGVILASEQLTPLYSPRYLTFTIPAFAILVAVLLDAIPWRPLLAAISALLLVAIAPVFVEQHAPAAKDRSTWAPTADILDRESAQIDGDQAVVYGPVRRHPSATGRIISTSYPDAFERLDDVTLEGPAVGLWEQSLPLEASDVDGKSAVWLVTTDLADDEETRDVLADSGFVETELWHLDYVRIFLFERP